MRQRVRFKINRLLLFYRKALFPNTFISHRRIFNLLKLMKHRVLVTFAIVILFVLNLSAQTPYVLEVWKADNGDGTYKNPIIFADYSDPDAIRVGDDFYLTASSFNAAPGLPILHSKDLVNWNLINYVFQK